MPDVPWVAVSVRILKPYLAKGALHLRILQSLLEAPLNVTNVVDCRAGVLFEGNPAM